MDSDGVSGKDNTVRYPARRARGYSAWHLSAPRSQILRVSGLVGWLEGASRTPCTMCVRVCVCVSASQFQICMCACVCVWDVCVCARCMYLVQRLHSRTGVRVQARPAWERIGIPSTISSWLHCGGSLPSTAYFSPGSEKGELRLLVLGPFRLPTRLAGRVHQYGIPIP